MQAYEACVCSSCCYPNNIWGRRHSVNRRINKQMRASWQSSMVPRITAFVSHWERRVKVLNFSNPVAHEEMTWPWSHGWGGKHDFQETQVHFSKVPTWANGGLHGLMSHLMVLMPLEGETCRSPEMGKPADFLVQCVAPAIACPCATPYFASSVG